MEENGIHSSQCKYAEGCLCSYYSVHIIIPNNGEPCHYSPEGKVIRNNPQNHKFPGLKLITQNMNKPNQSAHLNFQNQGPDYKAQAERQWRHRTTPSQIEQYLQIIENTFG